MKTKISLVFCLIMSIVDTYPSFAQNDNEKSRAQSGIYLGVLYSGISNPHFTPRNSEEISVKQSTSSYGLLAGYQYNWYSIGLGARAVYWHPSFQTFSVGEMVGSSFAGTTYSDPILTHISLDLLLEWIAIKKFYLGIYGLIGLASNTESYTISGSAFPELDGHKSITAFDYSWGLGIKVSPLKWVTALNEIRWIPGVGSTDLDPLGYSGGYYWYRIGNTTSKNHMTILSAGLNFNFGIFRGKDNSQD